MDYHVKNIVFSDIGEAIDFFETIKESLIKVVRQSDVYLYSHCSFRKPDGETIRVFWKGDPGDEIIFTGNRYSPPDKLNEVAGRLHRIERMLELVLPHVTKSKK